MGVEITAEIDSRQVDQMLLDVHDRGKRPPLRRIAVVGTKSVSRNFRVSGRPDKWAPLKAGKTGKRSDLKTRKVLKAVKHPRAGGKPLLDRGYSGGMASTVHAEYLGLDNVKIVSKHPFAPHHQYGTGLYGKKRRRYWIGPKSAGGALSFISSGGVRSFSKGHWHPGIKARPFIGWQEQDGDEIMRILANHLEGTR